MKSNTYWKNRFEQLEEQLHKSAITVYQENLTNFEMAQKEIESEIAIWYQRFATNNEISITEAKKWLNAKELKELKWDVEEYIKYGIENDINSQWIKELENASAKYHISRLEALKLQTRQTIETLYQKEYELVNSMVEKTYSDGYYRSCFEIQKGLNIGWDIGTIDQRKLQKIISTPWATDSKNFSERIWESKSQLINELHNELTRTCLLGKAPDSAINNIAKKFNTSKIQAGRLVMTEQAYFHSLSQKEAFNELDVEKFENVATLDSHTSAICQDMDGTVFNMKDYEPGVNAPPFHPYCRTVTAPYFDEEFELGERAAKDENGETYYVPSNMKYSEWKKQYISDNSKEVDIEALNQEINNFREKTKELDYEVGSIIDKNGNIIYNGVGQKSQIEIPEEKVPLLKNNVFIHNHPGGSNFSQQDLISFEQSKSYRILATTNNKIYSITTTDNIQPFAKEYKTLTFRREALDILQQRIDSGELIYDKNNPGQMIRWQNEEINKLQSKWLKKNQEKYGYIYEELNYE